MPHLERIVKVSKPGECGVVTAGDASFESTVDGRAMCVGTAGDSVKTSGAVGSSLLLDALTSAATRLSAVMSNKLGP